MKNSRGRLIPLNRAVRGSDLRAIQEVLDMGTVEVCNLFGVTPVKWSRITSIHPENQVEPPIALIARLIDSYLDLFATPKTSPDQVIEEMARRYGLSLRDCSLMMGRDQSAASRWKSGKASLSAMRLAELLELTVLEDNNISEWEGLVRTEGLLKTGRDVFTTGRWMGQKRQKLKTDEEKGD